MCRSLVGDDVDFDPHREKPGQDVGGVALEPDRQRSPGCLGLQRLADGVLEVVRPGVEVPRLDATFDPRGVALDAERDAPVHRDRERLRPAHAAEAGGEGQGAEERVAESLAGDGGERLVGPLEDALAPDVDPRARCHLPVHRQAESLETAELLPRRPLRHEVRIRDQHPRRPLVGPDDPDGLARLHEQGLVVAKLTELPDYRLEGIPRPGGAAGAAVDDQVVRMLGHVRVEIVHEHAERRFLRPSLAGALGASGRPNDAGAGGHRCTRSARSASCIRPFVASPSPPPAVGTPRRSENRPPASSRITGIGARS